MNALYPLAGVLNGVTVGAILAFWNILTRNDSYKRIFWSLLLMLNLALALYNFLHVV